MATQEGVRRIAMSLAEVEEASERFAFSVRGKGFAWVWLERTEPKGPRTPNPEVLAIRVDGELEKESLIAMDPEVFFTEPHYDGFPAVLVRLPEIADDVLEALLTAAWRIQAPKRLVATLDR
jgi:hypothetical protein